MDNVGGVQKNSSISAIQTEEIIEFVCFEQIMQKVCWTVEWVCNECRKLHIDRQQILKAEQQLNTICPPIFSQSLNIVILTNFLKKSYFKKI